MSVCTKPFNLHVAGPDCCGNLPTMDWSFMFVTEFNGGTVTHTFGTMPCGTTFDVSAQCINSLFDQARVYVPGAPIATMYDGPLCNAVMHIEVVSVHPGNMDLSNDEIYVQVRGSTVGIWKYTVNGPGIFDYNFTIPDSTVIHSNVEVTLDIGIVSPGTSTGPCSIRATGYLKSV